MATTTTTTTSQATHRTTCQPIGQPEPTQRLPLAREAAALRQCQRAAHQAAQRAAWHAEPDQRHRTYRRTYLATVVALRALVHQAA